MAKVQRFGYLISRCIDEIYNTVIAVTWNADKPDARQCPA